MISARMRLLTERMVAQERSPHRLALTCALGVFIGISPFIGLHTVMTFLFGWMFALSIPALFAISVCINNPWTMVPVYSLDHLFGAWLFAALNIDYLKWDPEWMEWCNSFLQKHTGINGVSLSAFLVGGNVLALVMGIVMYPLMKRIFIKYLSHT